MSAPFEFGIASGESRPAARLAPLKTLTALEEIDLFDTDVSDSGLAAYTGAKQLRRVGLKGTKITDDGLRQIENLPRLEELYVPQSVSDQVLIDRPRDRAAAHAAWGRHRERGGSARPDWPAPG